MYVVNVVEQRRDWQGPGVAIGLLVAALWLLLLALIRPSQKAAERYVEAYVVAPVDLVEPEPEPEPEPVAASGGGAVASEAPSPTPAPSLDALLGDVAESFEATEVAVERRSPSSTANTSALPGAILTGLEQRERGESSLDVALPGRGRGKGMQSVGVAAEGRFALPEGRRERTAEQIDEALLASEDEAHVGVSSGTGDRWGAQVAAALSGLQVVALGAEARQHIGLPPTVKVRLLRTGGKTYLIGFDEAREELRVIEMDGDAVRVFVGSRSLQRYRTGTSRKGARGIPQTIVSEERIPRQGAADYQAFIEMLLARAS